MMKINKNNMKNIKTMKFINIAFVALILLFASCGDDNKDNDVTRGDYTNGLYVMCEGTMGYNNATIDFFSFKDSVMSKDVFLKVNNQGLGETANDMISVGNDVFIVVSGSASVMVVDKTTCKLKKMIKIVNSANVNRQPRHITYYNNAVYVSCFDGNVVEISTDDYSIKGVLETGGRNPEGLSVMNGMLYVANSGGLSYPNYDNTVSVIDLSSFSFVKKITVSSNPTIVKTYNDKIYVLSFGDYSQKPVMTRISTNNEIIDSIRQNITDFDFYDGKMYYFYHDYNTNSYSINYLYCNNLRATPTTFFSQNIPSLVLPYHINIIDNIIYLTDAKNYTTSGQVFAFSTTGALLYSFSTSVNPSKILKL
jgi:hypothetical protein